MHEEEVTERTFRIVRVVVPAKNAQGAQAESAGFDHSFPFGRKKRKRVKRAIRSRLMEALRLPVSPTARRLSA
jgi:hypothetical protein